MFLLISKIASFFSYFPIVIVYSSIFVKCNLISDVELDNQCTNKSEEHFLVLCYTHPIDASNNPHSQNYSVFQYLQTISEGGCSKIIPVIINGLVWHVRYPELLCHIIAQDSSVRNAAQCQWHCLFSLNINSSFSDLLFFSFGFGLISL